MDYTRMEAEQLSGELQAIGNGTILLGPEKFAEALTRASVLLAARPTVRSRDDDLANPRRTRYVVANSGG